MAAALKELFAERTARDTVDEAIRRAVKTAFIVSGDRRFVVRRRDVHIAVADALNFKCPPECLPGWFSSEVNAVVRSMGGSEIATQSRRLFRGVRRRCNTEREAIVEAQALRNTSGVAKLAKLAKPCMTSDYTALLAAEGMPEEIGRIDPREALTPSKLPESELEDMKEAFWATQDVEHKVMSMYLIDRETIRDIAVALDLSKSEVDRIIKRVRERK